MSCDEEPEVEASEGVRRTLNMICKIYINELGENPQSKLIVT